MEDSGRGGSEPTGGASDLDWGGGWREIQEDSQGRGGT